MRIALITLLVLCCASLGFGQIPGSIGIFADAGATLCSVPASTIVTIHIVHLWASEVTACQFKVKLPPCLEGIGQNMAFPLTQGNFWDNVAISYQACLNAPIYLGSFLALDLGCADCTYVRVRGNTYIPPHVPACLRSHSWNPLDGAAPLSILLPLYLP